MLIRRATALDAEALLEHVNEVAAEEVYLLTDRVERSVAEERAWIETFDGRSSLLVVAIQDRRVVGSADFHRGRQLKVNHVAEVGIAIRAEARGQGLGRAILEEGIDWCRSIGVRKIFLEVFGSNSRAIALYRSLGFLEEGRMKGQVILRGGPDDLVILSLWLPSPNPPSADAQGEPVGGTAQSTGPAERS